MAKLFLYDRELAAGPAIAAIWKIDAKQQRRVDDLAGAAKAIGEFKQLEELVMYFHGYAGGIILGGDAYSLSDPKVAQAFAGTTTKIQHIRFEGCWVGEAPDEMAAFGRLFSSSYVSGFTWTGWAQDIEVMIPKAVNAKDLKQILSPYERWFMPGGPDVVQLASMAKQSSVKRRIWLLWYQYTLQNQPPYVDDNYKKYGPVTYKARSEAKGRTVEAKDAKRSTAPVPPFEYVTVKL